MNSLHRPSRPLLLLALCAAAATAPAAEPAKPAPAVAVAATPAKPEKPDWKKDLHAARERVLRCPEGEFEKACEDYLALFFRPDYPLESRIASVAGVGWDVLAHPMDVRKAAARLKAEAGTPGENYRYYRALLDWMAGRYGPRNRWNWDNDDAGTNPLDASCSREARIAFIEKGVADPALSEEGRISLLQTKAELLEQLFRYDEARQVLSALTATSNEAYRADAYVNLAAFFERRAERFYLPEWRPDLQNAVANYRLAATCRKGPKSSSNWGYVDRAIRCAIRAEDWDAAESFIDLRLGKQRAETNAFVAISIARMSWARKDYGKAADNYGLFFEKRSKWDQYTTDDQRHYAQSLHHLGRYEEELALLDTFAKTAHRNWRDYFAFCRDRLKERLGKKE